MKYLKRIVFIKKDDTIQLVDDQENVIRMYGDHGDDKVVCNLQQLNVVTDVLQRLGCTMDAETNVDDPEPCWVLYRRESELEKSSEHKLLVEAAIVLAGMKVLFDQDKVDDVKEVVKDLMKVLNEHLGKIHD